MGLQPIVSGHLDWIEDSPPGDESSLAELAMWLYVVQSQTSQFDFSQDNCMRVISQNLALSYLSIYMYSTKTMASRKCIQYELHSCIRS